MQSDIAGTIGAPLNLTADEVKPYVIVTIGNVTVNRRRLLADSVPVSFTLLGNISDIASTTVGGVVVPVDPSVAILSVTNVIASGNDTSSIFSTAAVLGATVPTQDPVTQVIVQPSVASSSTGIPSSSSSGMMGDLDNDTDDSSLSGGAIAGIVIGSIVGVLLLVGIIIAAHTGALCFKRNGGVTDNNNYNSVKVKSSDVEVV